MKRLIVCCDGTWNDDDLQTEDTNVARMARAVRATQDPGGVLQVVLYLRGVGTSGLKVETWVEGTTGLGIDGNIRSAYQFLAQNYEAGDEIYLFGFSRGAFTARSLVGLISACGLLERQALDRLHDAWAYYRTDKPHSPELFLAQCPSARIHDAVKIAFLGVWDTVGSLGIPGSLMADWDKRKYAFHDTSPSAIVKVAVHAMAIDEHRHEFVPTYWTGTKPEGATIDQVWFAGAHSDVGGGYQVRTLADIPLAFMARRVEAVGLALDWGCLPTAASDPCAPAHDSSSGLFEIDHLRPTLRAIGDRVCQVALTESLYLAVDGDGKRVVPINEAVHRSAVERRGKTAGLYPKSDAGACLPRTYQPETLAPFFVTGGFEGLPVVD